MYMWILVWDDQMNWWCIWIYIWNDYVYLYRILDVLFTSGVSEFWYKFIVLWNQICQLIAWVLVFGSIDQTPIILLGFQDRSTLLQVKEHSISWLYDFQFSNEKTGSDFLLYFHFTYFMYEFIQCYIEYYIGIQRILYLPYTRLGGWGHPLDEDQLMYSKSREK